MKRGSRHQVLALAAAALAGAASCASDPGSLAEPPAAGRRLDEIGARFVLPADPPAEGAPGARAGWRAPRAPRPVLRAGAASGFERRDGGVRAVIGAEATAGAGKRATVTLPLHARDPVLIEDDTSGVAVSFALLGATDAPPAFADGVAVYAGALAGADVVHRVHAEGTEDYLAFEERPRLEEVAYAIDVSRVAGLRLVGNALELLDEGGSPRLRVAPPSVVDANGAWSEATLALEGCAFDASPAAPWGRHVTPPGAARCTVRVSFRATAYPALLDPSWTATGSMATARGYHTATLLGSGKVLVAGGYNGAVLSSAELYDPATGTFAATGSLAAARYTHTDAALGSGKALIAGGLPMSGVVLSSAELYDPATGMFAPAGTMVTPRSQYTSTVLASGSVLLVDGHNNGGPIAGAEVFNPGAGTFVATGPTTPRFFHSATLLSSGQVLVAGGATSQSLNITASAELFDPSGAGSFSATGSMTQAREIHTATLLGSGKVLIAGGVASGPILASAELYDPSGTFTATGALTTARGFHTATLLGSGKVLVAGGLSAGATATAELYDPASGAFTTVGSLAAARYWHTATLLGSGKVLVVGGDGPSAYLTSAELFDFGDPGDPCGSAAACKSGFCVGGVCCDTACSAGPCAACTVAAGAAVDGTCALLTGPACDDGDACTQLDACQAGVCTGTSPVVCAPLDACHVAGVCAPATGACTNPAKPDGSACDDGDACTQSDTCQTGVCTGTSPVVCAAIDACHDAGACDSATGTCSSPAKADGTTCDDGDACTQADACQGGVCTGGSPVVCAAMDECHDAGSCDPSGGACTQPAKADGTPCAAGTCEGGVCTPLPDAGTTTSGSGGGGSGGGGGASGASTASTTGTGSPTPGSDGGCSCRAAGSDEDAGRGAPGCFGLAALALALLERHARRSRDRRLR